MALWREVAHTCGESSVAGKAYVDAAMVQGSDDTAARRFSAAGTLLHKMDEHGAAVTLLKRALAINETAYGREHTVVVITLTKMGDVLLQQGKLDEAMALHERALAIFETAYGR